MSTETTSRIFDLIYGLAIPVLSLAGVIIFVRERAYGTAALYAVIGFVMVALVWML